jgi:hypothetical protein
MTPKRGRLSFIAQGKRKDVKDLKDLTRHSRNQGVGVFGFRD